MFNTEINYVLNVQNDNGEKMEKLYCFWNGKDFVPLKGVFIVKPPISAGEALNNRVTINSIRKMS